MGYKQPRERTQRPSQNRNAFQCGQNCKPRTAGNSDKVLQQHSVTDPEHCLFQQAAQLSVVDGVLLGVEEGLADGVAEDSAREHALGRREAVLWPAAAADVG